MIENDNQIENLIISYFNQLTIGCDEIDCQEEECCSSTKFVENFKSKTEAAVRAVELTLNHPYNPHLCASSSTSVLNKQKLTEIQNFDILIKKIIDDNYNEIPDQDSLHTINCILSSEQCISYILKSNSYKLSLSNMAIDDSLMHDFPLVFQRAYEYFQPSDNSFHAMVNRFMDCTSPSSYSHVRGLLMILMFDIYFSSYDFSSTLTPLITHIFNLPKKASLLFWSSLQHHPSILRNILSLCESQLSIFMLKQPTNSFNPNVVFPICNFITVLHQASCNSLTQLKSTTFYNDALCRRLDPLKELDRLERRRNSFLVFPSILTMKFKHRVLEIAQENKQNIMATRSAIQGGYFSGRAIANEMLYNIIEIRRDHLVEDAIRKIPVIPNEDLMKKLVVIFSGEQGVDQGGVSREFFYLLINAVFSPDYGMFKTINGTYWFSLIQFEDYSAYVMLGTVVSLAIYNNVVLPIRFPTLLYKKILKKPIAFTDLNEIDPEFVTSAKQMIEMRQRGEDISELYLTFSTSIEQFGEIIEVPLIPNGTGIDVNNNNLDEYITAYVNWWANISIQQQFEAFSRGFTRISISKLFSIFAADELDILVSGEVVLDWEALKNNAKYVDGYNANSPQIKWFWEVFDTMDTEQKKQFLRFSTGSARSPVGGLGEVALTFQKTANIDMLPVSHTCFNMFSLPAYPTKEMLRSKVLLAIEHTEGFGLV